MSIAVWAMATNLSPARVLQQQNNAEWEIDYSPITKASDSPTDKSKSLQKKTLY